MFGRKENEKMTTQFAIQTTIEVILAAVAIWAVFSEGKLIKLEDKIVSLFRSRRAGRHALVISSEENYSECA